MSLLIDALRHAEQARQKSEGSSAETPELGLEALPAEDNVADLTPPEKSPPPPADAPSNDRKPLPSREAVRQQAARELFEVKQPAPSPLPLLVAILGLVVFVIGGVYLWWQMMQPKGLQLGSALITPPGTGLSQGSAVTSAQPITPGLATAPPPRESPPPLFAAQATAATTQKGAGDIAILSPVRIQRRTGQNHSATQRTASAETSPFPHDVASADGTPSIHRASPAQATVPGTVQRAYDALRAGDLAQAQTLYQQTLNANARNTDALNGLASIALHDGDLRTAERYFRATLEVDPKDVVASAQLALLLSAGDSTEAESRLRTFIATQPNAAPGYFALGNLLTRQSRWREAQQAFFQAHTLDPENPDVLFNLAVSLDHLNQPALAKQFYEQSLQAADKRPASFDAVAVRQRLQALATSSTPQR